MDSGDTQSKKEVPIGVDDFEKLIERDFYYVQDTNPISIFAPAV